VKPWIPALLALALGTTPSLAIGPESFLGQVGLIANAYCPANALPADGRLLSAQSNQALYALIGNSYGGKQNETFALPDLTGQTPDGMLYCVVVNGLWPSKS